MWIMLVLLIIYCAATAQLDREEPYIHQWPDDEEEDDDDDAAEADSDYVVNAEDDDD